MRYPNEDPATRRRYKWIVLGLAAVTLVLFAIAFVWWSSLTDIQVEEGPIAPGEAIADSAEQASPRD